jgi:hypothetical protein
MKADYVPVIMAIIAVSVIVITKVILVFFENRKPKNEKK